MAGKPLTTGAKPKPKPRGRPTIFSTELGDRICSGISGGKSLRKMCAADTMPDRRTVHRWLRQHGDFCLHYARACEERAHDIAEDMLEIADAPVPLVDGRMDSGAVQRARLRVDTRKWLASKLFPKVYGDRVQAEVTGADGAPMAFQLAPVHWDRLIARVIRQAGAETGSLQEVAAGSGEA